MKDELDILKEAGLNPEPFMNNSDNQIGWIFGKRKKYILAASQNKWRAEKGYTWYWYRDINELLIKLKLIEPIGMQRQKEIDRIIIHVEDQVKLLRKYGVSVSFEVNGMLAATSNKNGVFEDFIPPTTPIFSNLQEVN